MSVWEYVYIAHIVVCFMSVWDVFMFTNIFNVPQNVWVRFFFLHTSCMAHIVVCALCQRGNMCTYRLHVCKYMLELLLTCWFFREGHTCTALTLTHAYIRKGVSMETESKPDCFLLPTVVFHLTTITWCRCRQTYSPDAPAWRKYTYEGSLTLTSMTFRQSTWGLCFRIYEFNLFCFVHHVWVMLRCVFYVSVGICIHIVCMLENVC
jgi:hypothetical protein